MTSGGMTIGDRWSAPAAPSANGHPTTASTLSGNGLAPAPVNGHAAAQNGAAAGNKHAPQTDRASAAGPGSGALAANGHVPVADGHGRFAGAARAPLVVERRPLPATAPGSSLRLAHEEAARHERELRELRAAPSPREDAGR